MSRRTAPRPPSWLACIGALVFADFALRTSGLRRTVRLARRLGRGRRPRGEPSPAVVTEAVRRMATAAVFYPRRALCLEQSVGLYVLLARRGIPVDLRIGVHPLPFSAHAWVEHAGRPINEREDFVRRLTPFPSFES
ncbi:MAG: lasso peptide biosynthesis B2 protein [Gemmatimonadetes bacterium]|nr:lasso peptide biosynthesis B2 protein [Gemmatimonadota bacterium]